MDAARALARLMPNYRDVEKQARTAKAWRDANRAHLRQEHRAWREANREHVNAWYNQWAAANRDKISEKNARQSQRRKIKRWIERAVDEYLALTLAQNLHVFQLLKDQHNEGRCAKSRR